jgi:hypothetical protein
MISVSESLQDTIPDDFPKFTIDTIANPAPGYLFLQNIGIKGTPPYIMVLDSTCHPSYYYKPELGGFDFKMQPNGLFSYCSPVKPGKQIQPGPNNIQGFHIENILDSSFKIIDSVQMQNGYLADFHDFKILPNGNYLLLAYENNSIDMSRIITGGEPNANVIGTVIQELDKNKNCVFQWRSLDYIPIMDSQSDLLNASFEQVHGSSFFPDTDGNLLIALTTTGEIIKIDMVTGNIIWHLGGLKNQFDILGEHEENKPFYFDYLHDLKMLPNGNLLFYDNGFTKKLPYSRAVEYSIDEKNMKDSLVWEYLHTPYISANVTGSAQRLDNGNTLIDWGLIYQGTPKTATEVTPDKKIALELSSDIISYRISKYILPACQPVADKSIYQASERNTYLFQDTIINTGVSLYLKKLDALRYNTFQIKKYNCPPINLTFKGEAPVILPCRYVFSQSSVNSFNGEIKFDISTLPRTDKPNNLKVYYRPTEGSGSFSELFSNFDSTGNKVIANTTDFGEYIIGYVRNALTIKPPSLLYPVDKKNIINNIPVILNWSSKGRYDTFQLQISDDSLFGHLLLDRSDIKIPIVIDTLEPDKIYYWRAKTYYRSLISDWSEARSFSYSTPFLNLFIPNGGETWYEDSVYILRWYTNVTDSVKITLLKNDLELCTITDSLISYTNAYAWKIPTTFQADSNYKIKISSIKDSTIFGVSTSLFTIKVKPVNVTENTFKSNDILISNSPNPFSNFTTFEFTINESGHTKIGLFSLEGVELKVIFDEYTIPGKYRFIWDSGIIIPGIYFYKITSGINCKVEKMIIIK